MARKKRIRKDPRAFEKLNPKAFRADLDERYMSQIGWKNFVTIQRNPFVKEELHKRQHGKCPACGLNIVMDRHNYVVHHKSYMHTCKTDAKIKVKSPSRDNPNRMISVPDCETCAKETPMRFKTCISHLALVHNFCHQEIHKEPIAAEKSRQIELFHDRRCGKNR